MEWRRSERGVARKGHGVSRRKLRMAENELGVGVEWMSKGGGVDEE